MTQQIDLHGKLHSKQTGTQQPEAIAPTEIQKEVMAVEYEAVNHDAQRRLAERSSLTALPLLAAGSLMSIGGVPGYVLFVYPWLGYLVALWLLHNEISVLRKNYWLRATQEKLGLAWFGFLSQKKTDGAYSTKGIDVERINNRMVVGCEIAVLVVGVIRTVASDPSIFVYAASGVLLCAGLPAIWLTLRADLVSRKRRLTLKSQRNPIS